MSTKLRIDNQVKYSIVIPNLNGWQYLIPNVNFLLQEKRYDFEIIISDNHSTELPKDSKPTLSDERIKFFRPEQRLSMQQHYEFAVSKATGQWILLLGADDGVLGGALEKMDSLITDYPETEVFNWRRAYYFWPGVEDIYGPMRISLVSQEKIKVENSVRKLHLALLGIEPMLDLPQLYTCTFVKREVLERIKSVESKKIYPSCIPDLYSSVAIMLNTNHYIRSYVPLTLVGSSPSSLGIGNRIYQDSKENGSLQSDILHISTIKQIHEGKFNSYYLLDAYKTYCSFMNERVDKTKLIFGTIGTISEILAKGRVRAYLPEVVTVFGKKTVYISFVPLVCVGFVLNIARFGLTRWVRLFRWVNLRFDPKAWNIQIDEQFGLNSIEDALLLVAEESRKRQTR